jgi:hypothetical protein
MTLDKLREANIGTIKLREQDAISRKYLPKIKKFFRKQNTLFQRQFKSYKNYFPENKKQTAFCLKLIEQDRQFTLSDFDRTWKSVEIETTDQLQVLIYTIETEAMLKGGAVARRLFVPEAGGSFDLDNPRALAWFSQYGGSLDYISGIQNTTRERLKTIIEHSIDQGWSYNQTSKIISERFKSFTRERAQLIATHEAAQAYEAGNRIFIDNMADTGIVFEKKWQNSRDDKVTPECRENTADGWIPLDQGHTSGDQNPPRFSGCRCYENYRKKK